MTDDNHKSSDRDIGEETFELDEFPGNEVTRTPEPPTARTESPRLTARTELPFGLVGMLLLSLLVVVFTVQNTDPVNVGFLAWEGEFPLAVVVIAVVVVTVVIDEVAGVFLRRRRRRRAAEKEELRRLREQR
jgi:uncharacterized integral membrane protein